MGAEFHGVDREDNQYVRVTRVVEAEGQVGAVGVCACARIGCPLAPLLLWAQPRQEHCVPVVLDNFAAFCYAARLCRQRCAEHIFSCGFRALLRRGHLGHSSRPV